MYVPLPCVALVMLDISGKAGIVVLEYYEFPRIPLAAAVQDVLIVCVPTLCRAPSRALDLDLEILLHPQSMSVPR